MITYSLTLNSSILRSDGAWIPTDPANLDYTNYLAWVAEGNVASPYVAPPAPPLNCNAWQIRAALTKLGLRSAAEAAVAASTDQAIKDAWGFQQNYLETDAMLLAMTAAIGKTPEDLHNVMALAVTLSP